MSEIYNIDKISEGTFPLSFNFVYLYQREDPFLSENFKCAKYNKVLFAEAGIIYNL